jgi:hypothetical protein
MVRSMNKIFMRSFCVRSFCVTVKKILKQKSLVTAPGRAEPAARNRARVSYGPRGHYHCAFPLACTTYTAANVYARGDHR